MALVVPPGGSHSPSPVACPVEPGPVAVPCPETTPHHEYQFGRRKSVHACELSVIVVNYCQWRNTARLVSQLRRSMACRTGAAEIIIVDNHSPDHPLSRRLSRWRGVTLHRFRQNRGFAQAVNRGCSLARSGWTLLLNPDVTVNDGFLDDVITTTDRVAVTAPKTGVIGFRLRNPDGSDQASSGPHPSFQNTLAGLFLPRSRRKCRHAVGTAPRPVPWVTGGCLLVRRECFDQLGGLDENFFLYYEDADFCRRAFATGWSIVFDPNLEVTHHWPLHARQVPAPLRLITRHALLTYAHKHWPRWQSTMMSGLILMEAVSRRLGAHLRGDRSARQCYRHLGQLVLELCRGQDENARQCLSYAAQFLAPIAAEQDGKT